MRLYRDNEALRRWPTSTWQVGEIVRDEVDINLNPVTPVREYPVMIGVILSHFLFSWPTAPVHPTPISGLSRLVATYC